LSVYKIFKIFPAVTLSCLLINGLFSCRHETPDLNTYQKICFEKEVLPIFQINCGSCHTGIGKDSNYDFNTPIGIQAAVTPGNPIKSKAYQAITTLWGESAMPPSQPLSEHDRTLIMLWIEQGAEIMNCTDSNSQSGPPTYGVCFQRDIQPILNSNCAIPGCHVQSNPDLGAKFDNYSHTMKQVNPGHPQYSRLYMWVSGSGADPMPPDTLNPLTTAQIDSIYSWISKGALNQNCAEICDSTATSTFSGIVWPIIQNNCYGCHSGSHANKGFHLENYNDVADAVLNGKLTGGLTGTQGYSIMPPSGALSSCNIYLIKKWISLKYLNN
jgi:hypothetical protein